MMEPNQFDLARGCILTACPRTALNTENAAHKTDKSATEMWRETGAGET
jgi:hypothetical protein